MDAMSGSSNFMWLWGNDDLADVCLNVEFRPAHAMLDDPGSSDAHQGVVCLETQPACPAAADTVVQADTDGQQVSSTQDIDEAGAAAHISNAAPSAITKQYFLHSQLLGSRSAFFRASLTTKVGSSRNMAHCSSSSWRWTWKATMCVDDAAAVEAVLLSLYQQQVYGSNTESELLLRIIKVADLWQAIMTAEAASEVLCTRTTSFPLSEVYSLPEGLITSATFADVMVAAGKVLLQRFGNAKIVSVTPPLLQQFLSLPRAAVQTLLESLDLATDTEETVLLLFSGWCEGEQGQACSNLQLLQLNELIRYSRLSTSYLTELCGSLKTPRLTRKQLMAVLHFRSSSKQMQQSAIKYKQVLGPQAWYLPRRPLSTPHRMITLTLKLDEADLKALIAADGDNTSKEARTSPCVYSAGFLWSVRLVIMRGSLSWGVTVQGVSSLLNLQQGLSFQHSTACNTTVRINRKKHNLMLFNNKETCMNSRGVVKSIASSVVCTGVSPDPTSFEWWAQYMVDGCVHLCADIRHLVV